MNVDRTVEPIQKFDIINFLIRKYGYTSYIEISTPTTGHRHGYIDRSRLEKFHRLVYRCDPDFDDGQPVDFRSTNLDISEQIDQIQKKGHSYDIVFVDSFHTYSCSYRDLLFGLSILKATGIIVVHDCVPPDEDHAVPEFKAGAWCGETYAAFIDFVSSVKGIEYYTVDTDYGVGVIRKNMEPIDSPIFGKRTQAESALEGWRTTRNRYRFFKTHKHELLNLISAGEFVALEALNRAIGSG